MRVFVLVALLAQFAFACDDLDKVTPAEPRPQNTAVDYEPGNRNANYDSDQRSTSGNDVDYGGYSSGSSEP